MEVHNGQVAILLHCCDRFVELCIDETISGDHSIWLVVAVTIG